MKRFYCVAAAVLCAAWGCGEQLNSNSPSTQTASTQRTENENQEKASEAIQPSASLIRQAGAALYRNRVADAKSLIDQVLQREDPDLVIKMDAARILYGCGEMKRAAKVYDSVLETDPQIKPQLWQRGLALYYAERFDDAVDQFDSHQTYNTQDVENAVWHLLCNAKVSSVEEARKKMIQIKRDTRIPMKQVFEMFAGTGSPEAVLEAAGYEEGKEKRDSSIYHGLLYIGLFHEMNGDGEASIQWMKKALKHKPYISGLMGYVAEGHLRARKAYPAEKVKN